MVPTNCSSSRSMQRTGSISIVASSTLDNAEAAWPAETLLGELRTIVIMSTNAPEWTSCPRLAGLAESICRMPEHGGAEKCQLWTSPKRRMDM